MSASDFVRHSRFALQKIQREHCSSKRLFAPVRSRTSCISCYEMVVMQIGVQHGLGTPADISMKIIGPWGDSDADGRRCPSVLTHLRRSRRPDGNVELKFGCDSYISWKGNRYQYCTRYSTNHENYTMDAHPCLPR